MVPAPHYSVVNGVLRHDSGKAVSSIRLKLSTLTLNKIDNRAYDAP